MKINKDYLKTALTLLKPGLSKKEIIENADCFFIKNDRIITFNDELCFTHPIENCNAEFSVTSAELLAFLDKIKTDEITFTPPDESGMLLIRAGKAQAGFKSVKSDLPIDSNLINNVQWEDLPKDFITALKFAAMSASDDLTNPIINCVHITSDGLIEGTNNFRLSRWELKTKLPISNTLVQAESILKGITIYPSKIAFDDDWIHFKSDDGTTASCRKVLYETFPDTSSVLDKISGGQDVEFPDTINEVLDKATIFTDKTETAKTITIVYKNKHIIVESESEKGFFKERVSMDTNIGEFDFMINPAFLKDILKRTKSSTLKGDMLIFKGENWLYIAMTKMKL